MHKFKKIIRSKLFIRPLIASVLAILLTSFLASDVNSDLVMSTICGTSDIEVSDFYNRIRSGSSQRSLDDNIMIVNIDSVFSRAEIASLITQISSGDPRGICLDVLFEDEKDPEEDALLAETLNETPNIVVSQRYNDFDYAPAADFVSEYAPGVKRGMANLTAATKHGIVREITPFFGEKNEYPALSTALLQMLSEDGYNALKQRSGDEIIRFSPTEFYIADPKEVWDNPEMFKNRVVFLGTIDEEADLHRTAISDDYPGVMIHADTLQMMMHKDYIDTNSEKYNLLLCLISCLLVSVLYVYLDAAQNFVMRIFPIFWIAIVAVLGCWFYNKFGIYLNAPQTMLLACLSLVVLDTWYAFEAPVKKLWRKIKFKKNEEDNSLDLTAGN